MATIMALLFAKASAMKRLIHYAELKMQNAAVELAGKQAAAVLLARLTSFSKNGKLTEFDVLANNIRLSDEEPHRVGLNKELSSELVGKLKKLAKCDHWDSPYYVITEHIGDKIPSLRADCKRKHK